MLSRMLFGRSGGHYLFWTGAGYLLIGLYAVFVDKFMPLELMQMCWIVILTLPFAIPPFGRWLNMSIEWDIKMFEFIKNMGRPKKETYPTWADIPPPPDHNLPAPKETPPMPEVKPPAPDYGVCNYTVGTTSTGYVELKLQDDCGYGTTIKMNTVATKQLIKMLEAAMDDEAEQ